MKTIFTVLLCLCSLAKLSAQYNSSQNKVWAFGDHTGIDFRSGTPLPIVTSSNVFEGCASIANAAGLLFYTDGNTVFNRLGMAMPGGSAIAPSFVFGSATQSAVIVPFTNDTNKYFIFSLEGNETARGALSYSIVDMTLAGGLGDISGRAGVILDSGMSEKIISVRGNDCNVWLIVHKKDTASFYAYNISASGINPTPVVSNVGTFSVINGYEYGVMKCSHNRQKIATTTTLWGTPLWGVELYDFDASTGIVSNCRVLDANPMFDNAYGAEFSPDDTKLYTTGDGVIQWDISLPTLPAIISSKTVVCSLTTISDLKLGPDNKIYYNNNTGGNFLARIDFPNIAGTGCGCSPTAISLAPSSPRYGLPNHVWSVQHAPITGATSICVGMTTSLSAPWSGVSWTSYDTAVVNVNPSGIVTGIAPGTAIVSYTTNICRGAAIVTVNPKPAAITGPTLVCMGASITLSNALPGGTWLASPGIVTISAASGILTGVAPGTVNITYTDPSGSCSVLRTDTVKPCKVIVDVVNSDKRITLYPNPATNEITINADQSVFTAFVIYNAFGQQVLAQNITATETKANIKALPPGEYLVVLTGNAAREMIRFTKW